MGRRGCLTDKIQEISKRMIGREISQDELRLIAHIQYVMVNKQKLDPRKISPDDRKVLKKWKTEKHIEGGATGLSVTKEFWDFMCEILFEGYVKIV